MELRLSIHVQRFRVKCGLLGSEAGKGRLLDLGRMSANDAKTVYSGVQVQVSRFFRCIALAMVSVAKLIIEFTHHLGQSLLDLSGPATDL